MLISPSPPTRSSGDFMSRSLLRATPFAILNVAVSSEKSVRALLSAARVSSPRRVPSLALALRIEPAISMPFSAPSASLSEALPFSAFFSALTVSPCVVTSAATSPLPSMMSLSARSLTRGPMLMPLNRCRTAKVGVAGAALMVIALASFPW
jgi:hypothetical protein